MGATTGELDPESPPVIEIVMEAPPGTRSSCFSFNPEDALDREPEEFPLLLLFVVLLFEPGN